MLCTVVIHTIFLEIYKPLVNEPIGSYQKQHLIGVDLNLNWQWALDLKRDGLAHSTSSTRGFEAVAFSLDAINEKEQLN